MTFDTVSPIITGLGLGIALAGAPGPVQAVLLAEAVRGGIGRGLRALTGVHLTFGLLLVALALGFSVASPTGLALRLLKVAGGAVLLWLAIDGVCSTGPSNRVAYADGRRALPAAVRGVLAILLNPGGWLFLGVVASPLLGSAAERGGRPAALLAAVALGAGAALGDLALVIVGGIGLSRAGEQVARSVQLVLALILAGLGLWLLLGGVLG